jgi:hypothetical protein
VPDLRVAHQPGHVGQDRNLRLQQLAGLEIAVAGESPDGHRVAGVVDVGQRIQPAHVDQHRRRGQPQLHQGDEGVPPGQQLRLVAVLVQQGDGLLGRGGTQVVEGGGNHR